MILTQACLDYYCNNLEPLVSNCEYKATRDNKQEQFCSIPFNKNHSSIGKIQFHFRQNHGNVMKTCAHSIRVYGETKEVPKVKERTLKQAETCSELTYDYHHKSWTYNIVCFLNIKPQKIEIISSLTTRIARYCTRMTAVLSARNAVPNVSFKTPTGVQSAIFV